MGKSIRVNDNNFWIVELEFWDHCRHEGAPQGPVRCKVPGYLIHEDDLSYYICRWAADGNPVSDNSEVAVILKSTLVKPIKKILKIKSL